MDTRDMDWSVREFFRLDLGDERLNRRLVGLAETFAAQPEALINQACGDWQATKATYAFFANPKATSPAILLPHQERTLERMQPHPLVLLVQDTIFLNSTHHPATSGLGPIGGNQLGSVMHSTLASTPAGLPLGVLAQQIWARPQHQSHAYQRLPLLQLPGQHWRRPRPRYRGGRQGNAYVTGRTYPMGSTNFPTTVGAFQTSLSGQDAFVTKLNTSGSALSYSTFLGGSSGETGYVIAGDQRWRCHGRGEHHLGQLPHHGGRL